MKNIKFLNGTQDKKFKEMTTFIDLGITSEKSALLLNFLLGFKLNGCRKKWRSGRVYDYTDVVGGGLLVKCDGQITINMMDEIGIKFDADWKMDRYIRIASGRTEIIKSVKDKIANELKKVWNSCVFDRNTSGTLKIHDWEEYGSAGDSTKTWTLASLKPENINGDEAVLITWGEYRTLYEVLKGRNEAKIKAKYGEEAWKTMIGARIDNPAFNIPIEMIQKQIEEAGVEFTEKEQRYNEQYNNELNALRAKKDADITAARQERDEKIKELELQLKGIIEMGKAAIMDGTISNDAVTGVIPA